MNFRRITFSSSKLWNEEVDALQLIRPWLPITREEVEKDGSRYTVAYIPVGETRHVVGQLHLEGFGFGWLCSGILSNDYHTYMKHLKSHPGDTHTVEDVANKSHFHKDEHGLMVKCYHECKNLLTTPAFWIGTTIGFPLEHFLYTKVFPFTLVSKFLGLS